MKKALSLFLSIVLVMSVFMNISFIGSTFKVMASDVTDSFLTFELNYDKTSYTVVNCSKDATGVIAIPSEYNGFPVICIGMNGFKGCSGITEVIIPGGVTTIKDGAFKDCVSITSICLPDGIFEIGDSAFQNCELLASIELPDSLQVIGYDAFYGTAYYNNANNWVDGVLYINNCLIKAEASLKGDYGIRRGTKIIAAYAFEDCDKLVSVTLPEGVGYIGQFAFASSGIISITLPKELRRIENYAFYNCKQLKYVFFNGSLTEWQGITISSNGNKPLTDSIIHYETTGHEPSDWIVDTAATVNAAGSKYKKCVVCKEIIETAVIPQLTPATPKLVKITNANGCGVTLTWNSVDGADTYRVYRKTSSSGWTKLKDVTTTTYTDTTAKSGITYYYTVKAFNEAGASEYDKTGISIKYLAMPTVTLSNTGDGITIKWEKVDGASKYLVYRLVSGGSAMLLYTADSNSATIYTDKNVKSGTTYTYAVISSDGNVYVPFDSGVSVKYLAMPTVTIANASTGVKVSWNKISGASKYYVYRKASGENSWTRLTTSATGTSYTDTKAKSGTTYYYTVKAVSGSVASASKSSSALKYLAQPAVTVSNANSGITVKWGKITGASGYYVYRKTGSGSWSVIYTVNSGSTVSYTDKSAKAGTTYYYTVRAYSGSVKSTYTSSTAIRRLTTPTLKSVSSAKSGITFKWNKVTGASGYYVYRKTGSGGWQKIDTVKSGSTVSYLDKTAKKGTTYTYTVKAYYSSSISYFNTTGLKIKDKY